MANPQRRMGINDLPGDILNEFIFGKLPLWSQSQAKAVCKNWKTRLSRCRTRVREGWIIVNCIDHLLCYNVDQNRWAKKISIASLSLPLQNPRLCCVFQELFFFRDNSNPPRICCWNAATDDSRLLEIDPVPGSGILQFGAYTDENTGDLKLLLYDYDEHAESGRLFRCDVASKGPWKELSSCRGPSIGPNFNNLTLTSRVVTLSDFGAALHLYNVDNDSLETIRYGLEVTDSVNHYDWDSPELGGRFHFPAHGSFVVGQSRLIPEFAVKEEIGVLWYDPGSRKFELVSRVSEDVLSGMREECGGVMFFYRVIKRNPDFGKYSYFFCGDGVENIWVLLPGCSRMLRFNVVSRQWFTLPSLLPKRLYDAGDDDPYLRALYTTL